VNAGARERSRPVQIRVGSNVVLPTETGTLGSFKVTSLVSIELNRIDQRLSAADFLKGSLVRGIATIVVHAITKKNYCSSTGNAVEFVIQHQGNCIVDSAVAFRASAPNSVLKELVIACGFR